jgi:hypothetical protein
MSILQDLSSLDGLVLASLGALVITAVSITTSLLLRLAWHHHYGQQVPGEPMPTRMACLQCPLLPLEVTISERHPGAISVESQHSPPKNVARSSLPPQYRRMNPLVPIPVRSAPVPLGPCSAPHRHKPAMGASFSPPRHTAIAKASSAPPIPSPLGQKPNQKAGCTQPERIKHPYPVDEQPAPPPPRYRQMWVSRSPLCLSSSAPPSTGQGEAEPSRPYPVEEPPVESTSVAGPLPHRWVSPSMQVDLPAKASVLADEQCPIEKPPPSRRDRPGAPASWPAPKAVPIECTVPLQRPLPTHLGRWGSGL